MAAATTANMLPARNCGKPKPYTAPATLNAKPTDSRQIEFAIMVCARRNAGGGSQQPDILADIPVRTFLRAFFRTFRILLKDTDLWRDRAKRGHTLDLPLPQVPSGGTMLPESTQQAENAIQRARRARMGMGHLRARAPQCLKLERLERYVGAASPGVAANRDMSGARFAARAGPPTR